MNGRVIYNIMKLELVDSGYVREEQDSDYEMPFTEYWWKFKCPSCVNVMYHSSSYSVTNPKDKVKCNKCKKLYAIGSGIVSGKEKKP